jgi:uncharacterized RmlC-like cupin family protein
VTPEPRCLVLREGDSYQGRHGLTYFSGVASETAGSRGRVREGEFVYIPPGVPHLPVNFSDETVEALIARADPNEQESVVPTPHLDDLPHTLGRERGPR